ncbi:forespore capture DNA-binding protein RefZ [Bacillus sp. FJAT-50079]|uniref:forespore capture DNA-binding protein RefZ n=1 Tax=Bacillus sp. FJAT-50079 TaxID=2833577 RepID=UPI001BC8EEA2|nr:forespore capture DNA-binding protein RefZ [Bacillus sp. FJAT-50079]MBS4208744.1 forespore capture DNA-binding protein RefZ [Bacillus sp. FJAT-50079]
MTVQATTKDVIIEAAIELFNTKSFQGTTIRDIAKRANVNAANISYYFQGKQGLLEACLVRFFDPYVACLEEESGKMKMDNAHICLSRALKKIIQFQMENHLLTRFVWREISIDSQLTREIIASYLMKERFYLKKLIQAALKEQRTTVMVDMLVIQLKGMLMMPYLNSQYVMEVWSMRPHEQYYTDKYFQVIQKWLDVMLDGYVRPNHISAMPISYTI